MSTTAANISSSALHDFVAERARIHGMGPGCVLNLLNDIQDEYRYIPAESLMEVSLATGRSLQDLHDVINAFDDLTTEPVGEHLILVCDGTACHATGSVDIIRALENKLGVACGQTTPDGKFTLKSVFCVGACSLAPIVIVDGISCGHIRLTRLDEALAVIEKEERP